MSTTLNLLHNFSFCVDPPLLESFKSPSKFWIPKSQIKENDARIVIKVELPDVDIHDISLSITKEGFIILKGIKKFNPSVISDKSGPSGHFYRRYFFGSYVKEDNVINRFSNGILTITILKHENYGRRRYIDYMSKL